MSTKWPNLLGLVNPPLDNISNLQTQLGHLPGWAIFRRSMAQDRIVFGGDDYRLYTQAGMGAICCLEWEADGAGTLPLPDLYGKFADQCREYVSASHACHVWIVGDAMNCAGQWPSQSEGGIEPDGHAGPFEITALPNRRQRHAVLFPLEAQTPPASRVPIQPANYVQCYQLVREAIKATPGHQHDLVLVGAVAPWNDDFKDTAIPNGDWVHYFQSIATALPVGECDGFAMHTATAGADPDLLMSTQTLGFPFTGRQASFRCYLDFIATIPEQHCLLPVFLTEVSQLQPWNDSNDGWILQACEQILDYNRTHDSSPIRCLALCQWEAEGFWSIRNKGHLLEDLKSSLAMLERQSVQDALLPVAWEQVTLPPHVLPGETVTVRLQFTNIGEQPMLCSGDDPVRVGYRLRPVLANPSDPSVEGELRTPLLADVGIGESDQVSFQLRAPNVEGTYLLHLGFVKSQFVWSTASQDMAHQLELQISETLPDEALEFSTDDEMLEEVEEGPVSGIQTDQDTEEDGVQVADQGEAVPGVEDIKASEILDISAFLPLSQVDQPLRSLPSLNRLVILETGIDSGLSLDAMQEHFGEFGMGQIPFHFMVDQSGTAYRLQDPALHPDPYRRNMDHAVVIGLEGYASDEDQARAKLWETAAPCAQILLACIDAGMTETLQISTDTLSLQHGFSQFVQDDLEDFGKHLAKLCFQISTTDRSISISPVVLPPEESNTDPASVYDRSSEFSREGEPAVTQVEDSEEGHSGSRLAGAENWQSVDGAEKEPEISPFPPEMTEVFLDLHASDLENLGYAHSGRSGVCLWATGEPGNTPLQQIRRIHALRLKEILYHYVIDHQGQVYETRRSDRADNLVSSQYAKALHLGLQGEFGHQEPSYEQTKACALLLAHLSRNAKLLNLSHCLLPLADTPLRIGTEGWTRGQGWLQNVVREALELSGSKQPVASSEKSLPYLEQEKEMAAQPPLQPSESPELVLPTVRNPLVQNVTRVPQIVNKIGNLAQHPQLVFPVREIEAIRTICIHHANAPASISPEQLAESWLLDQLNSEDPQPSFPYHYFIHPDGTIDQCNDVVHVCPSVAHDNESIIAICLAGKFMAPLMPTPDQLEQTGVLLAWLMQKYFVSIDQVVGHKDIDETETLCPGEDWNTGIQWRKTLLSYVRRHLHPESLNNPF